MMFMCVSIVDLFGKFLRDSNVRKEGNFEFIVISDLVETDMREALPGTRKHTFISKYKNINFMRTLYPSGNILEYMEIDSRQFKTMYSEELMSSQQKMENLCCLVDLVLSGKNVILITGAREYASDMFNVMKDVLFDMFHIHLHYFEEWKVEPNIITNIGDTNEVYKCLRFNLKQIGTIINENDKFYNWLKDDMMKEYRQLLMSKPIEELTVLGNKYGLYINPRKPKEENVDRLLENITRGKHM